jgi:hypothetical protein
MHMLEDMQRRALVVLPLLQPVRTFTGVLTYTVTQTLIHSYVRDT